jgi:hypothetical protein
VGFAGGAAATVLALYLVHPVVSDYRFPIGPDGPVYTWLARYAAATGFGDAPGGGPGVPALVLTLGWILRTEPVQSVMLLGPVLAAACGLAAAAVLETSLGPDRWRATAAALLTGAFTAYLAGGWLANVTMVAAFLSALAALALVRSSWRAVAGAAALLTAAGLAHGVFLLIGLVILASVVAAHVAEARDDLRAGRRARDTAAGRVLVAAAGGAGLAILGFASLGGPAIPGDTSQDGFLRRLGLRQLLLERYGERFWGDLSRASVPVAAGLGLGIAALGARPFPDRSGHRFLVAVCGAWAVVTLAGIAILAATGAGPPNRMLQFAFFLPIGGAAGVAGLARAGGARAAAGVLAGMAFVAASMGGWYRQSPAVTADELTTVRTAGRVVAALAPHAPIVVLVDTDQPAAGYHVTRAGNVFRMGIPAERIPDVRLAVGRPEDLAAGRPTRTGDHEHDALSVAYLQEAEPFLDEATVLVLAPFNEPGYASARELGAEVAPGVAALAGPTPPSVPALSPPSGLGPVALIAVSAAALVTLGALGIGWARWALPGAGRRAVVATAPSVGIAVAILGAFAADRAGIRPGGLGSLVAVLALATAGHVLAARYGRGDG